MVMRTIRRHWDVDDKCIYCKKEIKIVLESEHDVKFHYKVAKCGECGRKLSIRVPFSGSDHDPYKTTKDLEKRLSKTWV